MGFVSEGGDYSVSSNFVRPLDGDLNQISIQARYLETQCAGFMLKRETGFVPGLVGDDEYKRALNCFWIDKVEGWWNYRDDLIRFNICSKDEFNLKLRESVESKRGSAR